MFFTGYSQDEQIDQDNLLEYPRYGAGENARMFLAVNRSILHILLNHTAALVLQSFSFVVL
jgi:hypothetical protein